MSAKIRKNDKVQIIAGKNKGSVGRVVRVQQSKNRVWVEGVNIVSRHKRGVSGRSESEIIRKEAPLDISNVMVVDPATNELSKVGFQFVHELSAEELKRLQTEGQFVKPKKVRYLKKTKTTLDK